MYRGARAHIFAKNTFHINLNLGSAIDGNIGVVIPTMCYTLYLRAHYDIQYHFEPPSEHVISEAVLVLW